MSENTFNPNIAIHPGVTLQDTIDALEMTQSQLAERTGLTPKTINEIIQRKNPITSETAIRLASVFGTSANFWNNLQKNYEQTLTVLEQEIQMKKETVHLPRFYFYKDLVKWNYIPATNNRLEKVKNLQNFYGVSSLTLIKEVEAVAFRKSPYSNLSHEALAAWLRCGEIEARQLKVGAYDKSKLIVALPELRSLTTKEPKDFQKKMIEICASCGVAVVFVPHFKNTFVNGATRWIGDKAIVQLSLRGSSSDIFWFTFFHELGHLIKHGKTEQFVEFEKGHIDMIEKEKEADEFAENILIPKSAFKEFFEKGQFSYLDVIQFANEQNISPGIVAGRLSKRLNDWKRWSTLRNRLKFLEK